MRFISLAVAAALISAPGMTTFAASPFASPIEAYADAHPAHAPSSKVFTIDPLDWIEQRVTAAGRGVDNGHLGVSVAVQGNFALIGAEYSTLGSDKERTGLVHAFHKRDGIWHPSAKLVPSDAVDLDFFGHAIAMDGATAVISSYAATIEGNPGAGAIYVYSLDSDQGWVERAKLSADDGDAYEFLGASVAISGDTIVAGAVQASPFGDLYRGTAYVFARNSDGIWSQQAKLMAPDGTPWAMFGYSVGIDGNDIIIGAMTEKVYGIAQYGSAHAFRRNSDNQWNHVEKLLPSDVANNLAFGSAVAMQGGTAIIGAQWTTVDSVPNYGAAYVFRKNSDGNWVETQVLTAAEGKFNDVFGNSVAFDGDTAVIGSYSANFPGADLAGAAYVYRADSDGNWTQSRQLRPAGGDDNRGCAQYGKSVAIDGSNVVVGAHYDSPFSIFEEGAAYFYGDIKPTDVILRTSFEEGPLRSC